MNSRNTFNQRWTLFNPPKNTEWPKWLTLPVHYRNPLRYIKEVKPKSGYYGLTTFDCILNCGHHFDIDEMKFRSFNLVKNVQISCPDCGGDGLIFCEYK